MVQIQKVLEAAVAHEAEDIILTVGRPPMLRLGTELEPVQTKTLEPEDTVALMKSITPERYQQQLQENGSADFGFSFEDKGRFRVAVFRQSGNICVVLRLIPNRIRSFNELGLGDEIKELLHKPRGLILVTGPTGSGKTTTLATMLDYINRNRKVHIITIEDPIEYKHDHNKSVISQRELGTDVPDFASALSTALRQAPDVILVGEMRDLESTRLAIMAAETGHLVFSTVHTQSAHTTVDRIIDEFPPRQQEQIRSQLSTSLLAVLSQTLLPRKNEKGMVAAYEILLVDSAVRNLIREKKTFRIDSVIQTNRQKGMRLMDHSLLELYRDGIITRENVLSRCRYADDVREKMKQIA